MAKQRIVVFGGTFDPVHEGHMQMARGALSALDPDLLLVMPSGSPPYKKCDASPEDRWRMVVCACALMEKAAKPRPIKRFRFFISEKSFKLIKRF